MTEVRAQLSNYRQSPRKVRVVADLVRGKKVEDAMITLSFTTKRAAKPLEKLLASALANAKNLSIPVEGLRVKEISVDGGSTLKRRRPRSHGMANPIKKRTSHVNIVLSDAASKKKK
ncbi:50S ribosomal protein L22 [Candidatus Parcubacteria bacterium]|nr:50S ribosomal protein L22 [Candidatus Parcubacteria bacterium]